MGALTGKQIKELVRNGHLVIEPFNQELVRGASCDLRLGKKILASPLGPDELGREFELDEGNTTYAIQTGQMVAVMSRERFQFPLDICSNSFGIRSGFSRKGLNCFGGPHIDPGWRGHLIVILQNIGPEPITIELDEPLFTITFERLEEAVEPTEGYSGEHQDQEDFPEEQKTYIKSARTTSLAEIPTLRDNVARLTVFVEELTDKLPDPDAGLELDEELVQRLHRSLDNTRESLLTPEEMRKHLNL